MDQATKHWKILRQLEPHILDKIDLFLVIRKDWTKSVMISIKNGLVYWYGKFRNSQRELQKLTKPIPVQVPSLMAIAQTESCLVMLTKQGQLYEWFFDQEWNPFDQGQTMVVVSPTMIECNRKFVSIRCGKGHCVALTEDGTIHTWSGKYNVRISRSTNFSSIIVPVPVFVEIACGAFHSLALTKHGKIYIWDCDELVFNGNPYKDGKGTLSLDFRVKRIALGKSITIILATDGKVYTSCWNQANRVKFSIFGLFGKVSMLPSIEQIASHPSHNLIIAMTSDRICYVLKVLGNWPFYSGPVRFSSIYSTNDSVLSYYGCDTPHSVSVQDYHDSQSIRVANRLCRMLDNPNASDVHFVLGSQTIYAHRSILVNSSSYFAQKFSQIWLPISDVFDDSIVQVPIVDHSYETFYAYIRFLYTDSLPDIDDSSSLLDELYELANLYQESELKHRCLLQMKNCLSTEN